MYKERKYCEKEKSQGGGQGICEWRCEAFVKIEKKIIYLFIYFFWGGGSG